MGKEIILPSPVSVFGAALALYPTSRFLSALWATFLRGLAAFGFSAIVGIAAGLASGLRPLFRAALAPILTVIRATPVLALVLIALLWFPGGFVPIFSAFLMAFPIMATSAAEGAVAVDPRLLEMAMLFRVPRREVFLRLRLPSAAPHLISGAKNALGISWKVVVAGRLRPTGTGYRHGDAVFTINAGIGERLRMGLGRRCAMRPDRMGLRPRGEKGVSAWPLSSVPYEPPMTDCLSSTAYRSAWRPSR